MAGDDEKILQVRLILMDEQYLITLQNDCTGKFCDIFFLP